MNRLGSTIIVDASVAVKWLAPEPDSSAAEAVAEGGTLAAPELLLVECANILWRRVRKGEMPRRDATTGLMDLRSAPLALHRDEDLVDSAQTLALDFDHPVYDCLYIALARRLGVPVITADRRFAELAERFPSLNGMIVALNTLR